MADTPNWKARPIGTGDDYQGWVSYYDDGVIVIDVPFTGTIELDAANFLTALDKVKPKP